MNSLETNDEQDRKLVKLANTYMRGSNPRLYYTREEKVTCLLVEFTPANEKHPVVVGWFEFVVFHLCEAFPDSAHFLRNWIVAHISKDSVNAKIKHPIDYLWERHQKLQQNVK